LLLSRTEAAGTFAVSTIDLQLLRVAIASRRRTNVSNASGILMKPADHQSRSEGRDRDIRMRVAVPVVARGCFVDVFD